MLFTTAGKRYCDVECNLIILSLVSFHISFSMLCCSLKISMFLNPSLLGRVTWNDEEVMTGLFVSLGGNGLEAEVN